VQSQVHNPAALLMGGFVRLVALGLVSITLHCMIVKSVKLVDLVEMCKSDCFGKSRLVPLIMSWKAILS